MKIVLPSMMPPFTTKKQPQGKEQLHNTIDSLQEPVLTIRAHSGLFGDMFFADMMHLTNIDE